MTKEQLIQTGQAMIAHASGLPVQLKYLGQDDDAWSDTRSPNWDCKAGVLYRPKPQPKRRPWSRPEDVPGAVCWIRSSETDNDIEMVIAIRERGIVLACAFVYQGAPIRRELDWNELEADWQYSTDRKTWHPCTIEE